MYNKITLYEGTSFGYLTLTKEQVSEADIITINTLDIQPNWDSLTGDPFVIMSGFEDTLASSYVSGLTEELTGWSIYRRETNKTETTLVAKVARKTLSIIDPMVGNGKQYRYYVFPETKNMIGVSMISEDVAPTSDWAYMLSGMTQREDGIYIATYPWKFSFNLTSGATTQNLNIASLETLGKFDKISKGKRNYLTASITCLLGDINSITGKFESDIDKLNAWRDFVANSGYCIWKDRLGDVRIVSIIDNPTTQYLDDTSEQACEINFSVKEVLGIDSLVDGVITEESEKTKEDLNYVHIQTVASTTWACSHGLDKYPEVTIVDFNGNVIKGEVKYTDRNTCILSFSSAIAGMVYFN